MTSADARLDGAVHDRTSEPGRFLAITVQLALVLAVVHRFGLEEGRGLLTLSPLILGGFIVHALLPLRLRVPFFLALSLSGFLLVLGPNEGALLIASGLALIGVCHLPVPWVLRIALLIGAGALLTALRASWIEWQGATAILPILGSIFMFRLVLYVYDLRTENSTATLSERLAYFFLLPNVLFPLFPIVDYKTFLRSRYARADKLIYAKGVRWMARGVVQLLIYRLIYRNYTPAADQVASLGTVALYMVSAYLLYLRVSGLFHFIVGVLCLFGFDLPETHHNWVLSSGFNDLWRRINIYWKDFMMKIVYYPIFIRLRRRNATLAMVVATVVVFAVSWWLHSYQWFWIRGTFPLTDVDAIFWGLFAVAVLANSLLQARSGAKRASLTRKRIGFGQALSKALKVVGMFCFMCVLWSFWTGADLAAFGDLLETAKAGPAIHVYGLGVLLVGGVLVGVAYQLWIQPSWDRWQAERSFTSQWAGSVAGLVLLLGLGTPSVSGLEDNELVASMRTEGLSQHDQELLLRGYYEEILVSEKSLGLMSDLAMQKPKHWVRLTETGALRPVDGHVLNRELRPDISIEFHEAPLTTNSWGMRDQEYAKEKPPGTFRIALLGASIEMGSGVANDEIFEAVTEKLLNERNPGTTWDRFEILNFAVNGFTPMTQLEVLKQRVLAFEPDLVMLFAHPVDDRLLRTDIERLQAYEVPIPYRRLRDILARAEISADLPPGLMRKKFIKHQDELVGWTYQWIYERCVENDIRPVWVYLQHPPERDPVLEERGKRLEFLADLVGFTTIMLDGEKIYHEDKDWKTLILRPWDNHPNPQGHRFIALELFRHLDEREAELGLGLR